MYYTNQQQVRRN